MQNTEVEDEERPDAAVWAQEWEGRGGFGPRGGRAGVGLGQGELPWAWGRGGTNWARVSSSGLAVEEGGCGEKDEEGRGADKIGRASCRERVSSPV